MDLAPGQFSRWARSKILENEFAEAGKDYEGFDIVVEGNGTRDYLLSASFAKKLAMGTHNTRGEAAKNYFVKVEKKLKQIVIQPQTPIQALRQAVAIMAEQEKRLSVVESELASTVEQIQAIKETIIEVDEDWRKDINQKLNKIAYNRGGGEEYRLIKEESYSALENRARCDLSIRLNNLRDRMKRGGETVTNILKTNYLDVIESDLRVKEIYTTIVKELAIRYQK